MRWDTGIDLGTANVRMADAEDGIVLQEPSVLALRRDGNLAYAGATAGRLLDRAPSDLNVVNPLKDGIPESTLWTERMLEWLLRRDEGESRRRRGVVLSVSPSARPAYREVLMQATLDAGASDVALVSSDAMAALGSGLPLNEPQAVFIADLGAGRMTGTVFAMGRVVSTASLPYGMNRIRDRIIAALRADHGFAVGRPSAEELMLSLISAYPSDLSRIKARVAGLDVAGRAPRVAEISSELVSGICEAPLRDLKEMLHSVISSCPEEIAADLNDTGVMLTGGAAQIPGLDRMLAEDLGIPCSVAESPELCTIRGIRALLMESERYSYLIRARMAVAQRR